jgi:CO/xanthine dehydrogenase FAD-binding subunit
MALQVVKAGSVRKAAALLASEPGALFVGGGTFAVRAVNHDEGRISTLVLSDGLGLDTIKISRGKATIGAAVTMAQIVNRRELAFLAPVATSIGGPAIRAMATVGGNLFARYPYGDFAVALLALGAEVTLDGGDGSQTVDLAAFLANRNAAPARIVTKITFAMPPKGAFRFSKAIRRKPHGASVLAIAAVLPVVKGKVTGARVAYGAMAPTAIRAHAVEAAIEGKALDAATIEAAAKVANEGTAPLSDPQASDWYRRSVLPVHLKRLLAE